MTHFDAKFAGPVHELYDNLLVPMLYEPFAADMAARVAALGPGDVLETAAGSGVVARALAPRLGAAARYVATDVNVAMLRKAKARQSGAGRVSFQAMDALNLGLEAGSFDVVFCQFGATYFADRPRGFAEARRVLRPGGQFVFSVWDCLDQNDIAATIWQGVTEHFAPDPPDYLRRVVHGYFVPSEIKADLEAAGFSQVTIEMVTRESRAGSARQAAAALIMGTPLRADLAQRLPEGLEAVADAAEAALVRRYGEGAILGKMRALVVTARA
jgi:ubiquinone/menaquinone biosynthesis C-methylase UbiE